jgi:hypothetical protein
MLLLALAACVTTNSSPPAREPPPLKGPDTSPDIRDSVTLAVDRKTPQPTGYGLHTLLLARSADRVTVHVLAGLLTTTTAAGESAMARENLNLIMIPVKNAAEARRTLAGARRAPEPSALAVMQEHYDYGQAAALMAGVCRPERGPEVMKVCRSTLPDGPLLVTTLPGPELGVAPGQRMLIVNLSTTPPEALREVLAAYHRQLQSADFARRDKIDGWRLAALNVLLDAAKLLPGISKAYAGAK